MKKGNIPHRITTSSKMGILRVTVIFQEEAGGKAGLCPTGHSPIGKLLNALIGEGPFCSSGVVWGMTFSRKDFMEG